MTKSFLLNYRNGGELLLPVVLLLVPGGGIAESKLPDVGIPLIKLIEMKF